MEEEDEYPFNEEDEDNLIRQTSIAVLDDPEGSSGSDEEESPVEAQERPSVIAAAGAEGGGAAKTLDLPLGEGSDDDDEIPLFGVEEKQVQEAPPEDDLEALFEYMKNDDYDTNELAKGLECLLEDLKLEARITERFKYKLENKYNILLHALIGFHDRKLEVMEHLKTKKRILEDLNNFVKNETELKDAVMNEEAEEAEEGEEQDVILDFHKGDRLGAEEEEEKGHADQGLSIEEMDASTIRETLLQQKNRLDVLEAIKRIHVLKLKQKEFEKTLLTLHYSKMIKPADLNKEIKEARRVVNDLQTEILSLHQEMGQVQTEVRIHEKIVTEEERSLEKLELEMLTKQGEVSAIQNKPILLQKEADREAQKLEQLQDEYDMLCRSQQDSMEYYKSHQNRLDKLNIELSSLAREEQRLNSHRKNSVREIERLMTQMEALMTREQIMLDRAAQMSDKLTQANKLKKRIHEEQQRIVNDANKALRVSQRLERSIKLASEAFFNAKLAHEKMRFAFDAAKPAEEDSNWQKLSRMLEREIANLKKGLEVRTEESAIKASMVDRLKEKLNELYDDQVVSGKELQELVRTTIRKRREREEKSEQCIKLDAQILRFDLDIKMRELVIEDCKKTAKEFTRQIEIIKKRIGVVKLEKSAVLNDIAMNREKLMESRSVLKQLEYDMKVVGQRILDLEKELKDKHYLILDARLGRDSVRCEIMRSRDKFRYHRDQKDELLLGNKTLRKALERMKIDIAKVRKEFETSLTESNGFAINVRERAEEICTFSEYIHAYDAILLRGGNEISLREMERTKLLSLNDELRKHVLIVKLNQPDESQFVTKIEEFRQQFYDITLKRRALEQQFNEDDNPERIREIKFDLMKTRENVPALETKLDSVECLLAWSDAVGLERTLIENHVAKIADDSLSRALQLKDTYGEECKVKVNIRKNLSFISRKIDGFICENSIAAAQAHTAEYLYLRFQKDLADAEVNLENGLPPNQEIEAEWNHLQWRKEMMRRANQKRTGFLVPVKHKEGWQINSEKLKAGVKRPLERPEDTPLPWRFSVEDTAPLRSSFPMELKFQNSAINHRASCLVLKKRSSQIGQSQSQQQMPPSQAKLRQKVQKQKLFAKCYTK